VNIVLINPNASQNNYDLPPQEISDHIGLGYIAAVLRKEGHICTIIDADLLNLNMPTIVEMTQAQCPDVIGITLLHDTFPQCALTISVLKINFNIPVFVGGHLATIMRDRLFDFISDIDYILVGEAEDSIVNFIDYLSRKKYIEDVPNLIYKKNNSVIINSKSIELPLLNEIPWPVRDNATQIFDLQKLHGLPKALRISSSRGCHGSCHFCSINTFYSMLGNARTWRHRPIADVVDEMIYLHNKFKVNIFYFSDDNFIGPNYFSHERVKLFCDCVKKAKLKVNFSISTRIDGIDYGICKMLKEVGLTHVGVGLENICSDSLSMFNKEINNSVVLNFISVIKELNISFSFFMIIYHPFTTIEKIYLNYCLLDKIGYFDNEFKKRNAFDILIMSRLLVRRFTPFEEILRSHALHQGYLTSNPMIVNYKFNDDRVEKMWLDLYKSAKGDEENTRHHFVRLINKYSANTTGPRAPKAASISGFGVAGACETV